MAFIDEIKGRYRLAGPGERQFYFEYDEVRASSLSRIYQYTKDPNVAVGMISGFLTDNAPEGRTHDDDVRDTTAIAAAVRRAGFGYVWLKGYWKNTEGKQVEESSILIYAKKEDAQRLKETLANLRDEYLQTAFAFKPAGTEMMYGVGRGGEVEYGKFSPDKMGEIYSRLAGGKHAGRSFIFAATAWALQTPSTHAYVKALIDQGKYD